MPTVSKRGNVWKKCQCKGQSTCRHPWLFYTGSGPGRRRGNLDRRLKKHAPDLTTAQQWFRDELPQILVERPGAPAPAPAAAEALVRDLLEEYARETPTRDSTSICARLCRTSIPGHRAGQPLGDWLAAALTVPALKAFRRSRPKTAGQRDLAYMKKAYNDGLTNGVITATPFRVNGRATFGKLASDQRYRRLVDGEEAALRAATTTVDLDDFIVAAIATACRAGELADVQVRDLNFAPNRGILLLATKTKTHKDRWVPILPALRTILDRRLLGPDGKPLPPTAYVFGDATGAKVTSRKTAWLATVLRAHGYAPTYTIELETVNGETRRKKRLSKESRAALQAIDLHFHDLRREGASRWLESGTVSIGQIQVWLGHANISQTSTYLRVSVTDSDAAMARYAEHRNLVAHRGTFPTADAPNGPSDATTLEVNPPKASVIH